MRGFDAAMDRVRLRRLRAGTPAGTTRAPLVAGDALSRLERRSGAAPSVVLLAPTMRADAVFAGLRTALEVAGLIARQGGYRLRIRTLDAPSRDDAARASRSAARLLDLDPDRIDVSSAWAESSSTPSDVWVATYYTTALAIERACARGVLDRDRVVYLVQDHEPSFFSADSIEARVAARTYEYGFRMLVNSEPLRKYLVEHTSARGVTRARTFRPALDLEALRTTAAARRSSDVVRIGFYARPDKPRNAFETGRDALRSAGARLRADGVPFTVHTLGGTHAPFDVGGERTTVLGRLSWDDSFRALSEVDVLLSLQLTPHPSHPPLDAVASGGHAVTNDTSGTRGGFSDRLRTARCAPEELADALYSVARTTAGRDPAPFDDAFVGALGRPLPDAVGDATAGL
jgi:O-antigen biosynthesis protein